MATQANNSVSIRGVSKIYKSPGRTVKVLDSTDYTIPGGAFRGLVGRSGAGKTTLLNLIGGLDRPDSGSISFGDYRIDKMSDEDLSRFRNETIGFVFQNFFLRQERSALDNVMTPLLLGWRSVTESRKRARQALENVGLGSLATTVVHRLSGGQRQRVAIARAIANQPKLLLADEPTVNLDKDTGREILELLMGYNQSHNATILMVTHDPLVQDFHIPLMTLQDGKIVNVEDAPAQRQI